MAKDTIINNLKTKIMDIKELFERLTIVIKNGNRIVRETEGEKQAYELERMKEANVALMFGRLDAIDFRDIFVIENEDKAKSYNELRELQGSDFNTIKGIRKLHVCVFNKQNDFKGTYIPIN